MGEVIGDEFPLTCMDGCQATRREGQSSHVRPEQRDGCAATQRTVLPEVRPRLLEHGFGEVGCDDPRELARLGKPE